MQYIIQFWKYVKLHGIVVEKVCSYDTKIQHGCGRAMPWISQGHGFYIQKSEVSNTIRHNTLPILMYPGIIGLQWW